MSDKYMKEIEDILKQAEDVMPADRAGARGSGHGNPGGQPSLLSRISGGRGLKISAGKLMLASFALLLLALVLGAAGFGSVVFLVAAGLILFVIAYALFFIRPGASYEKRWRGRIIEDRPSMLDRMRRWLRN